MSIARWFLLFALTGLALLARAEQLADLPYGVDGHPRKTLDLYVPADSSVYPVLVHVAGNGWQRTDKRAIGNRALAYNAIGQGVVALDYRQQPEVDWREQLADLAEGIAWIRASIRRYGGNPDALILHGEGSGAHLIALLLSRAEEFGLNSSDLTAIRGVMFTRGQGFDLDPERMTQLAAAGSFPAAMLDKADWIERSPFQLWSQDRWPVLLLHDATSLPEGSRFAARLKERGAATTERTLPSGGDSVDTAREWSTAWLKSLALGRIQRLDSMDFRASFRSGQARPSGDPWQTDRVGHLTPYQGLLFAAMDAASTENNPVTRLVRLDGPDFPWQTEFQFPPETRRVDWLGTIQVGQSEILMAATGSTDNLTQLWRRQVSGQWVQVETPFQLAQAQVHSVLSRAGTTLVLSQGRAGGVWQIVGKSIDQLKVVEEPELRINGSVAGMIASGRDIYGVWQTAGQAGRIFRRQKIGDFVEWLPLTESDPEAGGQAVALGLAQDETGQDILLIAHWGQGRITRWQPGSLAPPQLEFEIDSALRTLWQDEGGTLQIAARGFVSSVHPETNERVDVLGIGRIRAHSNEQPFDGAHFLVRQQGGHYSLASVHDFDSTTWSKAATVGYAPSPFVADQGRSWYFSGAGISESGNKGWIEHGHLNRAVPKRGPWWDRGHSGHGFDLQKIGDQWAVVFYSFDTDGTPMWWSALGQIEQDQFTANANGLMLTHQALLDGQWTSVRVNERSGSIRIRFGASPNDGVCRDGADRTKALALAELAIDLPGAEPIRWCIEPMQVRASGQGEIDNNGIWTAGLLDTGWGLSLIAQGHGRENTQGAMVYYYDASGQPRWALGSGTQQDGRATLTMFSVLDECPDCAQIQPTYRAIGQLDLSSSGLCGDIATRASINLHYPDLPGSIFQRNNVNLFLLNESACY